MTWLIVARPAHSTTCESVNGALVWAKCYATRQHWGRMVERIEIYKLDVLIASRGPVGGRTSHVG